jgi:hypothetical protein
MGKAGGQGMEVKQMKCWVEEVGNWVEVVLG